MYIFGGKHGDSNAASDYSTSCLSLDLSMSFSVSSAPWYFTCAEKGPLLAGHSAAINTDINMVVLYGGTVPDGDDSNDDEGAPVHLFSAIIKSWSTPDNGGFPLPLVNHSAIIHEATGDMIIYGGAMRSDSSVLSTSTLRMVTDIKKHSTSVDPPSVLFTDLWSSDTPSTPQSTDTAAGSHTTAETSKSTVISSSEPGTFSTGTTAVMTSTKPSTLVPSTAKPSSTAEHILPTSSETLDSSLPIKRAYEASESLDIDDEDGTFPLGLVRRSVDDTAEEGERLMGWTNSTLPSKVPGRVGHTASIVNGTTMVVLGGSSGTSLVSMKMVYIYNPMDQTWVRRSATGAVPASRRNHVATVVNSTLIVVHGGTDNNFTTAMSDVAVLNTTTWKWSAPQVKNAPSARYAHSAAQAGPYMILTFGYTLPHSESIPDDDYGLYILDTNVWEFVSEFNAARSKLSVYYRNSKPTGGTIFGLFVASLVGLLVLLILLYIGCMHYYNRHPRLSDSGETATMLPSTELRNFGRRLTGKFGTRRRREYLAQKKGVHQRQYSSQDQSMAWTVETADRVSAKPPTVPKAAVAAKPADKTKAIGDPKYHMYDPNNAESTFSLTNTKPLSPSVGLADDTSVRIMFDLSRESSFDYSYFAGTRAEEKDSTNMDGTRRSKRMHLDNVELPVGLRNRDSQSASRPNDKNVQESSNSKTIAAIGANGTVEASQKRISQESDVEHGTWSRPTTSASVATHKSTHVSAMLPRIVGSRLTLPAESATALARYRFDELEDMPDTSLLTSLSSSGKRPDQLSAVPKDDASATLDMLVIDNSDGHNSIAGSLAPPIMPAAVDESPLLSQRRLSISSANSAFSASTGITTASGHAVGLGNLRDSIDINAVLSQNQHFYVANPDT
ncbi:hypothetical protein H4217_002840 [Coemansia sp. RSA 1939]|nr:hypothetical protein H4217_002840 [Coemansia sp. RSA 1939]KAJ2611040.1 hypothetical protein EV177_003678 [Coemansia sp. RSA 1804]